MDNLDLLYDIKTKKLDKSKSWYYAKENIVFLTGEQFVCFSYILEATNSTKDSVDCIIIFGKNKFHPNAIKVRKDGYGRLKYKPVAFKDVFIKLSDRKDINIDFEIDRETDDYSSFKIVN